MVALAEDRAAARAGRDFPTADRLRDEIAAAGWLVRDTPAGFTLTPRPPYEVAEAVGALPDRSTESDARRLTLAVLVEGWPDDLRRCVAALLAHAPADAVVLGLDVGDVDGAGEALHALAEAHPGRVEELHVAGPVSWAAARTALLRADVAAFHIWVEPSVELTGDAISPMLAAFDDPGVVAAGAYGVDVAADWRSFHDARPGDVDALNGYLVAFRRSALLAAGGPHPKARFYRNADLELAFTLRQAGGRVVMTEALPVTLHRHRGYADSDPAYRDRESRRNYDRFLARFRGRDDLRARRGDAPDGAGTPS